ncbi:MAG: hypothetical protein SFV54_16515 [Bryobacteraceae bacterium]|nr:hypothetical protein [Bryobacteraceae bacterium]
MAAVRHALEAAAVPYALAGSWASTLHGEPRQTNDIDIVGAFTPQTLARFLNHLGTDFYYDLESAREALALNRPFNVIHRRFAFKFDFFPAHDDHGAAELDRRQTISIDILDDAPLPVVTAEDILIAKLRWFRAGGEVATQQWRDILGVLRAGAGSLDESYLQLWVRRLALEELWDRARREAAQP